MTDITAETRAKVAAAIEEITSERALTGSTARALAVVVEALAAIAGIDAGEKIERYRRSASRGHGS